MLEAFGAKLGSFLRMGDSVALSGGLGAGKTTLARGLIQAEAGAKIDVPSPTYTLVQSYDLPQYELWHCDFYRLEHPDDVLELGLPDMAHMIVSLIEWPDKIGHYLEPDALHIEIIPHDTHRQVILSGSDIWAHRLVGLDA